MSKGCLQLSLRWNDNTEHTIYPSQKPIELLLVAFLFHKYTQPFDIG